MLSPPAEAPASESAVIPPTQLQYPPYREPSFEMAVAQSSNIAKMIVPILEASPRDPPQRLIQEAERLAAYQRPVERLVGFIGNSGAGKSSTINSLFDNDGLAKTGSCGSAVTPFAAEYRFRQADQGAPFTLCCRLMVEHELGKYVGDLLRDLWRISSADKTDSEENDPKIFEDTKAARDIFETTFGGMDDFDMDRLNYDDNNGSMTKAKNYLMELCSRLEFPDNMTPDGIWVEEAQDADECDDHQSLLHDRGLWPLVISFSIFSDSPILENGLTLIDLPGFNDTNLARIRAARKAQSNCDEVCLVVEISRATDNPLLQQNLEHIRARAEAQKATTVNITIICTKSAADLDRNRSLEKLVNTSKLLYAKAEVQKAKGADEKVKQHAQRRLTTLLITTRNEKVQKDLLKKYGSYVKGGILKVFCVDNVMYWNATGDEERELSGIPALRQHLRDLPAESLFKASDLFLAKKIPALVSSYATWVESCRIDLELENRPPLPDASELRMCLNKVGPWADEMLGVFERCFNTPLKAASESIRAACLKVAQGWEKWKAGSVASCVRHDGNYTGGALGPRNWNNELLQCFDDAVMGQSWHHFEVETDPLLTEIGNIITVFQGYASQCSALRAPVNFQNSLAARVDVLKSTIEAERKFYLKGVGAMRSHAIGTHQDSYIVDCMLETYREASRVTGLGSNKTRHSTVQKRVGSEDFVEAFRTHLLEEFQDVINGARARIKASLELEIEAIESDLEAIQPSKDNQRLFKVYPAYGETCEDLLSKVTKQLEETDELAGTARAMAKERYG
ncbi:uncharacterized protein PV07_09622 [Cladophialophora immunda]|uniref:DUF7605 domain-containing protein n=1 Tax=Cladophialophora immunda TaxID=569365 RepID=A0A0D2C7V8_9EURO|nr:uncharacterized protein PV07_09622 [Cladophialophora immunda]KIW26535.1 hypothetical protein PV07_09622 [Cladophialophora immunda]OQV02386.1 hypothetical protein CLAIMM_07591 [Cladophialophora immunda]